MNPVPLFLIIVSLPLLLGSVCHAELRTWTAVNGKEVEAEFVSNIDGQVSLKMKTGKVFKVPLNNLSKGDQDFLKAKASPKEPTKGEVPVNPNLKYEIKGGAITITGCDKKASGELIIPATIEGKTVTSIENLAFQNCKSLTSITIGNGVTSIGKQAFYDCTSLTSIMIPDSVTSIGKYAFSRCTSVTSITIGNGVTSIGDRAFWKCTSLTSITIGNGVASIGGIAFSECTSLTSIMIPDSVTSIGQYAFYQCRRLTAVTFLGDAPNAGKEVFNDATPTIYRKPDAKGWGDAFAGRPVKLISEKP